MKLLKNVNILGKHCEIVISDENVALREAFYSHKATIAILGKENIDISVSKYAVTDIKDIDEEYIKKVAYRKLNLPISIGKVDNINICEMKPDDFIYLSKFSEFPFDTRKDLEEYIDIYYDFYGYGLYAFENEKELMGLAGFYNKDNRCFISYIIDKKYRRKAYSFKVCKYLMDFIHRTTEIEDIYAEILSSNIASVKLAEKLGVIIVNKVL